jgi:hypothetical protein
MNRSNQVLFTALSLKVTGIILILSAVLDYILLPWMVGIPFNIGEKQWQLLFVGQMVDRGLTPIIGIGFIFSSYWLETKDQPPSSKFLSLKFWGVLVATILGVLFLIFIPVYISNLNEAKTLELENIDKNIGEVQNRLQGEYDQLTNVLQNEEQLKQVDTTLAQINQALTTGKFNGQELNPQEIQQLQAQRAQLENLKTYRDDPQALESRIKELKTQIETQKNEKAKEAKNRVLQQGLRIGLRSLFLAVGYIAIAWFGWKSFN